MKKRLFSAVGLVLALPIGANAQSGVVPTVANPYGASALLLNPAAISTRGGVEAFLGINQQGGDLLFTTPALSLGYQRQGQQDLFHVGTSYQLKNGFSLGTAYHSNLGVELSGLYRPFDFLSLGLTSTLVNPNIRFGIGVRPIGDRLTLTADTGFSNGQFANNGILGMEWEPTDGLFLRGIYETQGVYGVGVGVRTPQLGAGFLNYRGNQGYLSYSQVVERAMFKSDKGMTADLMVDDLLGSANPGMFATELRPPVYPVLKAIEDAKRDPEIGTMSVRTDGLRLGLADAEEMREAILNYRASGKAAVGYLSGGDTLDYYVMSACDRIVLAPLGELELLGISSQHISFKGLFDLLGIRGNFLPIGRYKSAAEPFTRKTMSDPNKQQWNSILEDDFGRIVEAIASARKLPRSEVIALINRGLFSSQDALQAKLVDDLGYPPEANLRAGSRRYRTQGWSPRPKIAIVSAFGNITGGEQNPQEGIGSETLAKAIKAVGDDSEVKAVVFYINSGGGSAIASEEIRHALEGLRKNKPIVAVMGNMAASGGYWISLENNRLFANPSTLTGSIGVVQGKFDLAGTFDKLGIGVETLKRGEKADIYSMSRGFSPSEEKALKDLGFFYYQKFTEMVANKRNLSTARVMELAEGRVYTGNQAKSLGLIDQLGGLSDAVQEAKKIVGVQEAQVVFYPKQPSLLELLVQ